MRNIKLLTSDVLPENGKMSFSLKMTTNKKPKKINHKKSRSESSSKVAYQLYDVGFLKTGISRCHKYNFHLPVVSGRLNGLIKNA